MVISDVVLCSVLVELLTSWITVIYLKCALWPSLLTIFSPVTPGLHLKIPRSPSQSFFFSEAPLAYEHAGFSQGDGGGTRK